MKPRRHARPTSTHRSPTERSAFLARARREAQRWSAYVDQLRSAFQNNHDAPGVLRGKLEELRHKRDSVLTKLRALEHHRNDDWSRAEHELREARRELRNSWRSVVSTLEKESAFV